MAEAFVGVGALDDSWEICEDHLTLVHKSGEAHVWTESRERIRSNLRKSPRDRRQQCTLARVGKPNETDIRNHFQAQFILLLLALFSWIGLLYISSFVIAESSSATFGHLIHLSVFVEIDDLDEALLGQLFLSFSLLFS